MAIAADSSADGGTAFSASNTWSHTTAGANLILWILFAIVSDASGTQDPASGVQTVTFDGVAATEVGHTTQGAGAFTQANFLFALANPNVGAKTVSIGTSITPFAVIGQSASYTGTAGTVDNSNTGTQASATSLTVAVTPSAANCWTIFATKNNNGSASAGTGSNLVLANANGAGIFDSNGTVAAGVPYSMQATVGLAARWDGVIASFGPAGGGGSRGLFQPSAVNGLGSYGSGFYGNPLAAPMHAPQNFVKRDRIFVPARLAA